MLKSTKAIRAVAEVSGSSPITRSVVIGGLCKRTEIVEELREVTTNGSEEVDLIIGFQGRKGMKLIDNASGDITNLLLQVPELTEERIAHSRIH